MSRKNNMKQRKKVLASQRARELELERKRVERRKKKQKNKDTKMSIDSSALENVKIKDGKLKFGTPLKKKALRRRENERRRLASKGIFLSDTLKSSSKKEKKNADIAPMQEN